MSQDERTPQERIFCDALDQPPDKREAYVEERCANDRELREQVMALLQEDAEAEQCSEFHPPSAAEIIDVLGEERDPWGNPLPSEVLDYTLEAKLGEGGMGVVYQAHDNRLNCKVAIKFISEKKRTRPESLARFRREQTALGGLDHPNVVRARAVREWHGFELLVMDFVEGDTLAAVVKKGGALDAVRACTFAKQIAEGLEHAHDKDVIHRDLKPLNLVVTPDGTVKVLDFGVASLASSDGEQVPLTESGVGVGTFGYMAPEVVGGGKAAVRWDLFSLGCVLYFMLTGKSPSNSRGTERNTPAIPKQLNSILDRLLAEDPNERYATASEVRDALAAVLRDLQRTKTQRPTRIAFYSFVAIAVGVWLVPWLTQGQRLPFSQTAYGWFASVIFFATCCLAIARKMSWREVSLAITCGLLAAIPVRSEPLRPMSFRDLLTTIHAALDGLNPNGCRSRRFLDLTGLGRRAIYDRTARDALRASQRLLERLPGVQPIDDQHLIYMIPWDADLWARSCAGYSYALNFADPSYVSLRNRICKLDDGVPSQGDLPMLRGDWWIAVQWARSPSIWPDAWRSPEAQRDVQMITASYIHELSLDDAAAELWLANDTKFRADLRRISVESPLPELVQLLEGEPLDRKTWDASHDSESTSPWKPGVDSLWQIVAAKMHMGEPFFPLEEKIAGDNSR